VQFTTEESLSLHLRQRSFRMALADQRVQGALIASTPGESPPFFVCACCCYPTVRTMCDTCMVCGWEDDLRGDSAPDVVFAGNCEYSLNDARRNFLDGGTMYRETDRHYAREMNVAEQRRYIRKLYDDLLPYVHPWAFIAKLPRLNAAYRKLTERKYGKKTVRKWRAASANERRYDDRNWEVWNTIAGISLPQSARLRIAGPPSLEQLKERLFQTVASESDALLRDLLGSAAPELAQRGRTYRCWSLGERTAWLRPYSETRIGLNFEPESDGRPEALLPAADTTTPAEIARRLAEFFGRSSRNRSRH